jgi:hypothetical protein
MYLTNCLIDPHGSIIRAASDPTPPLVTLSIHHHGQRLATAAIDTYGIGARCISRTKLLVLVLPLVE